MQPNTTQQDINAAIEQADWLAEQSGYNNIDDLYQSDPDLFIALAAEYRDDNPWTGLGE